MSGHQRNRQGGKMRSSDRSYYGERAEAEIEAADRAAHPVAARAHYVLAAYYLDLAHNPEPCGIIAFATIAGDFAACPSS
jgi:hypothetical protein